MPSKTYKRTKATSRQVLDEQYVRQSMSDVECMISNILLFSGISDYVLTCILSTRRCVTAFRLFLEKDIVLLRFLQIVENLTYFIGISTWIEKAKRVYDAFLAPKKYISLKLPEQILSGLQDIFEPQVGSKFEQIAIETLFMRAGEWARTKLVESLPKFVDSCFYSSWRNGEASYHVGMSVHDNLVREDEFEKVFKVEEAFCGVEARKPSPSMYDLIATTCEYFFPNNQIAPTSSLNSQTFEPSLSSCCEFSIVAPVKKISNFHLHNTDPWLAVLLGAFEMLPVGLSLHGVREGEGFLGSEFPYVYVNPYFSTHCGGFAVDEMYGKNHDFLYSGYKCDSIDSSGRIRLKCCDPVVEEVVDLAEYDSILSESDEEKIWTERNVNKIRSSGSSFRSKGSLNMVQSKLDQFSSSRSGAVAAPTSAHFLYESLVKGDTTTASIPLRTALLDEENGYLNVMAWKPIMSVVERTPQQLAKKSKFARLSREGKLAEKEKLEESVSINDTFFQVKYYLCLQLQVPVADMAVGLTMEEWAAEQEAIEQVQKWIDFLPEKLIFEHTTLHFCS